MSLVTITKDHIELFNTTFDGVLNTVNLQTLIQQGSLFLFSTIKSIFLYLITFQWFKDFVCFPLRVPEISHGLVVEHLVSNVRGDDLNLFKFLQPAVSSNNKLFLGFLNSFFLSLPVSANHLIAIRRLLIQGIPAGIAAGLGVVLGHCLLVASVVFGLRFVTIPWFSSEPFTFVVGLYLTTSVIYDMTHQRSLLPIKGSERSKLIRVFLLSFALCWTEQACVFQSFSNFNLDPKFSPLEVYSSNFLLPHLTYSVGFLIGSVLFTSLFGLFLLWLFRFLPTRFGWFFSKWINLLNFGLLSLIFAFAVATTPYYGFDYLVAKPLGFLSQDKSLLKARTIFSQDIDVLTTWILEDPDELGPFPDLQPFQRSQYIGDVDEPRIYEQHNFGGEHAANTRQLRMGEYNTLANLGRRIGKQIGNYAVTHMHFPKMNFERLSTAGPTRQGPSRQAFSPAERGRKMANLPLQWYWFADVRGPHDLDVILDGDGGAKLRRPYFQKALQYPADDSYEDTLELTADDPDDEPNIVKRLRDRYYLNPIYKSLLNTEIDFFVGRQQSRSNLSPDAEADLFDKRLKLAGYYNTLRAYSELDSLSVEGSSWEHDNESFNLENLFQGPKSYATHVYNQQFKGTLRIVRRLFSLTLLAQEADEADEAHTQKVLLERVLKFDQPLFRDRDLVTWHEELTEPLEGTGTGTGSVPEEQGFVGDQVKVGAEVGREVEEDVRSGASDGIGVGEKVLGRWTNKRPDLFVRSSNCTPLYAGWDQRGRRFVLTNSLLPRMVAGYEAAETSRVLNQSVRSPRWSIADFIDRDEETFETGGAGSKEEVTETDSTDEEGIETGSADLKEKGIETGGADLKEVQNGTIGFTTWPLKEEILKQNLLDEEVTIGNNPYQLFYESSNNPENAEFFDETPFSTLDKRLKRITNDYKTNHVEFYPPYIKLHTEVMEIIPPSRGGFVWPGNKTLKLDLVGGLKR